MWGGPYRIVYADPPWTFKTWSHKGKERSAEQHYGCMSIKDIKNLPVNDITQDNCSLFLWATDPCYQKLSLSWKRGALSIKQLPLFGQN